jgi:hypothetical protein
MRSKVLTALLVVLAVLRTTPPQWNRQIYFPVFIEEREEMICTNCKRTGWRKDTGIDVSYLFNCQEGIGHVCSPTCKEELIINLKNKSHWRMKKNEYILSR